MPISAVRPYIMDLGSTNGTYLNNERLESQRYYELLPKVRDNLHMAIYGKTFWHVATDGLMAYARPVQGLQALQLARCWHEV